MEYINLQYARFLKENFKDITSGDSTYLMNIFYNQNISQRELSDLLFVSESNVAQIIKRLEKNGFVERIVDENNKSRKNLNLTNKGKLIVISLIKIFYEGEVELNKKYTNEEIELFKNMLYDYSNLSIKYI